MKRCPATFEEWLNDHPISSEPTPRELELTGRIDELFRERDELLKRIVEIESIIQLTRCWISRK